MDKKEIPLPTGSTKEHLNLRLIVAIPVVFILVSLATGLLAMSLTQLSFQPSVLTSKGLLVLRLSIVGFSLLAGLLGALLAFGITKPVRRAIAEAQKMIQYVAPTPPAIKAANEVRALSTLFDRAFVSFVELVQAREMLDNVQEGIVALDPDGRVAGMNLRAEEILEVPLAEARHKTLDELLSPTPANRVLLTIADSTLKQHEERAHNRVPFSSPSGKEIFLTVKLSPLKLKTNPQEVLGAVLGLHEQPGISSGLPEVIGRSDRFMEVMNLVAKIAPADSTVLLLGESGTGKELIADSIHRLSRRKDKPFIKLNCAAIPEGLLESELFGHEKGAFTGAVAKKPGKFDLADGGTIFLDEIGDMSPSTQVKILRVLQERELTPVGGTQVKQVNVRIIAATNKDLLEEVQLGRFREDLFYRLNVITISVPPLRERKSDIPFLADHFLERVAARSRTQKKSLSRGALDCLLAYSWPGNVRELENAMERATLLSNGATIQPDDLPVTLNPADQEPGSVTEPHSSPVDRYIHEETSLNQTLEAVEKELIIQALKKSGGIQVAAAKLLGLNHKNLWHKIRKHKIDPSGLRNGH